MRLAIIAAIITALAGIRYYTTEFSPLVPPVPLGAKMDAQMDEEIKALPANERAEVKATLIKTLSNPRTVVTENLTIEIQSVERVPGGVVIFARAWDSKGQQLGFVDGTVDIERFIFYNPPVIVPDPLGTIEREYVDRRGTTTAKFRYDPRAAITSALEHTILVSGKPSDKIEAGKIGHTTTTVYPNAHVETTSVDGYLVRNTTPTEAFTTLRGGNGTVAGDSGTGDIAADLFAGLGASNTYQALYRGIYFFDTSAIADSDVVSAATISICSRSTKIDGLGGNGAVGITSGTAASNTALAASDFQSNTSGTRLADTDIDMGSWAADSTYNNWTLNASGIAAITLTGVSKFASKLNFDIDNTTTGLTWASGGEILARNYLADNTGTSCDPKLVITHAAAAAPAIKPIQTVFMVD